MQISVISHVYVTASWLTNRTAPSSGSWHTHKALSACRMSPSHAEIRGRFAFHYNLVIIGAYYEDRSHYLLIFYIVSKVIFQSGKHSKVQACVFSPPFPFLAH